MIRNWNQNLKQTNTYKIMIPGQPLDNRFVLRNLPTNPSTLQLCQAVIKEVQSCDISQRGAVALTSRIAQELSKFSASHLVAVAETCMDLIRSSTSESHTR